MRSRHAPDQPPPPPPPPGSPVSPRFAACFERTNQKAEGGRGWRPRPRPQGARDPRARASVSRGAPPSTPWSLPSLVANPAFHGKGKWLGLEAGSPPSGIPATSTAPKFVPMGRRGESTSLVNILESCRVEYKGVAGSYPDPLRAPPSCKPLEIRLQCGRHGFRRQTVTHRNRSPKQKPSRERGPSRCEVRC